MKSRKLSLSTKIVLQAVVILLSFSVVLTWVFLQLNGKMYEERMTAMRAADAARNTQGR